MRRDLLQFGGNLADMSEGLEDAGDVLRAAVRGQFLSEGVRGGRKWPELAESTKAHRAREKGLRLRGGALRDKAGRFASAGHPILRVHDDLFDSLVKKMDPRHVESASEDTLVFGSTVPHGVFHQSKEPRTKIPYRPMVVLTEADKRAVTKALQASAMRSVGSRRRG